MRKHLLRYVIAPNQIPARFPLAWILLLFMWQERMEADWARWLFYMFTLFAFLIFMNKKFLERQVEIKDLVELEEKETKER